MRRWSVPGLLLVLALLPAAPARPQSASGPPRSVWYLAEGTTREDFAEFILVFNPNAEDVEVRVDYLIDPAQGGAPAPRSLLLAGHSRTDIKPFEELGPGIDHGTVVSSDQPIVVERALYLDHAFPNAGRVNGATAVFAQNALAEEWSFAEGTTLPGFDTFYLLSNPRPVAVDVSYSLGVSDGRVVTGAVGVPAGARVTLRADELIGAGREGVSAFFSAPAEFLAERAVYFSAPSIAGSGPVNGAHAEAGAQPAAAWNFAEGNVLTDWYEFLTLGNPGELDIQVTLSYQFEGSSGPQKTVAVPARGRRTVQVFDGNDPGGVGRDVSDPISRGVSVRAVSNAPFVMERPLYFDDVDTPRLADVNGGHVSKGIAGEPALAYSVAEGTTRLDFDTFFTFQNPNVEDAELAVTYYTDIGSVVARSLTVPAGGRVTTQLWNPLEVGKGALGEAGRGFGALVMSTNSVSFLVERPLYEVHEFPGIDVAVVGGTVAAALPLGSELLLSLRSDQPEVLVGEDVDFTIDVTNAGSAQAEGSQATLRLPPGFSFVAAGSSQDCAPSTDGRDVACPLGDIGTGVARSVTVRARALGAPVTAVARASAQGAGLAAGRATVAVVVAETTLGLTAAPSSVTVTNTGTRRARNVVLEDLLPAGATPTLGSRCGRPPEAGGLVTCLVDPLDPGGSFTLSWTGGTGANIAEAKGDNSTRAHADGTTVTAHPPGGVVVTPTLEGAVRSFRATGGVRLRPDVLGAQPAIEVLPAGSAELVGGLLSATVTGPSVPRSGVSPMSDTMSVSDTMTAPITPSVTAPTAVHATWTESDGTRFDLAATVFTDTAPPLAYYQTGGIHFDTKVHGATARPNGPGAVPDAYAQILLKGLGLLRRTDGRDGTVTEYSGAGFHVAVRHYIAPPAPGTLPWQVWAEIPPPTTGTTDYGGGFSAPGGLVLADLVLQWTACPNTWSGDACPAVPGVEARSIVFTTVTPTGGFELGGL